MTCTSCLYFTPYQPGTSLFMEGRERGICQRYPRFENRAGSDWCGEHRERTALPMVTKDEKQTTKKKG